jgi:hypothetical protein
MQLSDVTARRRTGTRRGRGPLGPASAANGGAPLDVAQVVRQRLDELGREQKDLAVAAEVTESYISQLLARKKLPPAPDRTDIYGRMARFLKLPADRLSRLADHQRREALTRRLSDPPAPLLKDVRELVLRKCVAARRAQVRAIFEKDTFGPLERLVTQKLLDVVKRVAKSELETKSWLRLVARLSGRSYEDVRVIVLDFLDTDVLNLTADNCAAFLDPLIESWDIDLASFGMDIVMNRRLAPERSKRFEFVEREPTDAREEEPGFREFLAAGPLSGDASDEEVQFLRALRFGKGRRPNPLYYYRELQNLRDPIHFQPRADRARRRGAGAPAPAFRGR